MKSLIYNKSWLKYKIKSKSSKLKEIMSSSKITITWKVSFSIMKISAKLSKTDFKSFSNNRYNWSNKQQKMSSNFKDLNSKFNGMKNSLFRLRDSLDKWKIFWLTLVNPQANNKLLNYCKNNSNNNKL